MVYYAADDYGLNRLSSARILQCMEEGALNKVSVFPNFEEIDFEALRRKKAVRFSLHLNLVEGFCMADPQKVDLLAERDGRLRHTFGGLFRLAVFRPKELEEQAYGEIKAQVLHYKSILPEDAAFCIDGHQHTHMIPPIFKAMMRVLREEAPDAAYLRIPAEPITPYLACPSLYGTYRPVNLVKQWLLKVLWGINQREWKKFPVPTAYFFGILLSGQMDEKRVKKILPHYLRLAEKKGRDLEVLFHPGYLQREETDFEAKNIPFAEFYHSPHRRAEYEAVQSLGGTDHAVY